MVGFTVEEYLEKRNSPGTFWNWDNDWFRVQIPVNPLGQCPYCQVTLSVRADFHSLFFWDFSRVKSSSGIYCLGTRDPGGFSINNTFYKCCEHLFTVDSFVNFRGQKPLVEDHGGFRAYKPHTVYSEVPGLIAPYFHAQKGDFTQEDIETEKPSPYPATLLHKLKRAYNWEKRRKKDLVPMKAVISKHPGMQIRGGRFEECLDFYFVFYYTPEPNDTLPQGAEFKWKNPDALYHTLNIVAYTAAPEVQPLATLNFDLDYNLEPYVQNGQLYWWADGKLHGPDEASNFPYGQITGRRTPFQVEYYEDVNQAI